MSRTILSRIGSRPPPPLSFSSSSLSFRLLCCLRLCCCCLRRCCCRRLLPPPPPPLPPPPLPPLPTPCSWDCCPEASWDPGSAARRSRRTIASSRVASMSRVSASTGLWACSTWTPCSLGLMERFIFFSLGLPQPWNTRLVISWPES